MTEHNFFIANRTLVVNANQVWLFNADQALLFNAGRASIFNANQAFMLQCWSNIAIKHWSNITFITDGAFVIALNDWTWFFLSQDQEDKEDQHQVQTTLDG